MCKYTEADIASLRQLLSAFNERDVVQLSKNIANVTRQGNNIQIGDRFYQGADAETIRQLLQQVLAETADSSRISLPPIEEGYGSIPLWRK